MNRAQMQFLLLTGAMIGLMFCFSLAVRGNSRLYRWAQRIFWAAAFLWGAEQTGLMGLNGFNLAAVCCLGAPGAAMLVLLSFI